MRWTGSCSRANVTCGRTLSFRLTWLFGTVNHTLLRYGLRRLIRPRFMLSCKPPRLVVHYGLASTRTQLHSNGCGVTTMPWPQLAMLSMSTQATRTPPFFISKSNPKIYLEKYSHRMDFLTVLVGKQSIALLWLSIIAKRMHNIRSSPQPQQLLQVLQLPQQFRLPVALLPKRQHNQPPAQLRRQHLPK